MDISRFFSTFSQISNLISCPVISQDQNPDQNLDLDLARDYGLYKRLKQIASESGEVDSFYTSYLEY